MFMWFFLLSLLCTYAQCTVQYILYCIYYVMISNVWPFCLSSVNLVIFEESCCLAYMNYIYHTPDPVYIQYSVHYTVQYFQKTISSNPSVHKSWTLHLNDLLLYTVQCTVQCTGITNKYCKVFWQLKWHSKYHHIPYCHEAARCRVIFKQPAFQENLHKTVQTLYRSY